jgi:hypothetical protein
MEKYKRDLANGDPKPALLDPIASSNGLYKLDFLLRLHLLEGFITYN